MSSSSAGPLAGAFEGREQRRQLPLATIELLWDAQLVGEVLLAEGERGNRPGSGEQLLAANQIGLEAGDVLVAIFGVLGQKSHDDLRHHAGPVAANHVQRQGRAGDMTVHELEGIVAGKGQDAGAELVEGHAQRIEIRTPIDRAVHAPGLLRGHVRQRSFQSPHLRSSPVFQRQARRCPELDQRDVAGVVAGRSSRA